jgi:leader peptidase (prepilin peptidase) / N-methyltransferase
MLAMIGAFLGWKLTLLTLVGSSIAGACVGIVVLASRRGGLRHELPYGTFLALAALAASLFGTRLVDWYIGFYA